MNNIKEKLALLNFSDSQKKLLKISGVLLGVIILLVIVVSMVKAFSSKKISYKQLENVIVRAAKSYVEDDPDVIEHVIYGTTKIDSSTLVSKGYMKDLKKYLGKGTTCTADVLVYKNLDNYSYIPKIDCGEEYKNVSLSETIIKGNVVEKGAGLYEDGQRYVYRGEYVDNYVKFSNQLWRIVDIDIEGNLRLLQVESNKYSAWDNRYNSEYKSYIGINDYEGVEPSRIKDMINSLYNDEKIIIPSAKKLIVPREYCIGKRLLSDNTNDSSTECLEKAELMGGGLITVSDYLFASLDENCTIRSSKECTNYNYIARMGENFWTATAVADNSKDIYYIASIASTDEAKHRNLIRLMVSVNGNVNFVSGTGTKADPYLVEKD